MKTGELREQVSKAQRFESYRLERTVMEDFILILKDKFVNEEQPRHAICHKCREADSLSIMSEGNLR